MSNTATTAINISAGTCFPFSLDGLRVGDAVIVGHSPGSVAAGCDATGVYLGHTLDGLAVVQIDGRSVDLGAGPGVEEWPADLVASQAVA